MDLDPIHESLTNGVVPLSLPRMYGILSREQDTSSGR